MKRSVLRFAAVFGLAFVMVLVFAPVAGAAIAVAPNPVALTKSGDTLTGTVKVSNNAATSVTVTPTASGAKQASLCNVTPLSTTIGANTTTPIALTFEKGCADHAADVILTLSFGTAASPVVLPTSVTDKAAAPDWNSLKWFALGFPLSFVAVLLGVAISGKMGRLLKPTTGLDASWSFQDSWVANITLGSTLLTGIFASTDILTKSLGDAPNDVLAVMLVAGALAVGLAGAGVLLTKTFTSGGQPIAIAVVLAAFVTFAGAAGQIIVTAIEADTLDLGPLNGSIEFIAGAAGVVLALYAVFAIRQFLIEHAVDEDPSLSEALVAGALAALQVSPSDGVDKAKVSQIAATARAIAAAAASTGPPAVIAENLAGAFAFNATAEAQADLPAVRTRRIRSAAMF